MVGTSGTSRGYVDHNIFVEFEVVDVLAHTGADNEGQYGKGDNLA